MNYFIAISNRKMKFGMLIILKDKIVDKHNTLQHICTCICSAYVSNVMDMELSLQKLSVLTY